MREYCPAPFVGFNARADGTCRACCSSMGENKIITKLNGEPYNLHEDRIEDVWNSEWLNDLRSKMVAGEDIGDHCSHCNKQDNLGIHSIRQKWLKFAPEKPVVKTEKPEWYDIRMSSTCDLACVMCSSPISSKIYAEHIKHYDDILDWEKNTVDHLRSTQYYKSNLGKSKVFFMSLWENISSVKVLEFRGGEPLIDPPVIDLIDDLIASGDCKNIKLDIVTNGQTLNQDMIDKFNQFESGMLRYSIDGFGKVNEYIRWGSDWDKTVLALETLQGLNETWNVMILPTISALNVLNIDKLLLFLEQYNFPIISNMVKEDESGLEYTVIPFDMRLNVAKKLHNINPEYANFISAPENGDIEKLRRKIESIDKIRGISVYEYIPEMRGIL